MQEQDNKTLPYSQQWEDFNKHINTLQGLLKGVAMYNTKNHTLLALISSSISNIRKNSEGKYYALMYLYGDFYVKKKLIFPDSVNVLLYILCCMLAENHFKNNDEESWNLLQKFQDNQFSYELGNDLPGQRSEVFYLLDEQKNFISYRLPSIILKGMSEDLQERLDSPETLYNKMYQELKAKNDEIQKTLNEYQTKADNLVDFIKKQQSKLNFVGLGSAFKTITKEKNTDKNNLEKYLKYYFGALLVIPIIVACALYFQEKPNYYFCIPATTIELIVLYAFRLFYQQYLFVKSELQQVNLRHSLCAFIESYMEFKKDNKDNTVDLFEQLIFSNIISDEKKVPATVDGLDGIVKIIETIKGK